MNNKKESQIAEIVKSMKVGWNMGNSLEAMGEVNTIEDYETSWGNPRITREMVRCIKAAGLRTIRIPVTWEGKFADCPEYLIDKRWMARVKEVVDYAIEEDLFVIINVHHEDGWLRLGNSEEEALAKVILKKLWQQIATVFVDYDNHLIFETMNETRMIGTKYEWNAATEEARNVINELNAAAIEGIRSSGGYNSLRPIGIKPVGARYSYEAVNALTIPKDDNMIFISVHAYVPYFFCMLPDETAFWGNTEEQAEILKVMNDLEKVKKDKGVPIVISEFGTINKDNDEVRAKYTSFFVSEAKKRGIVCILWDNNIDSKERDNNLYSYAIFDRERCEWRHPAVLNALIANS